MLSPFFRCSDRWRALWIFVTSISAGACFYDHRVTQAIMERRQRAKAAEGAKIRAANVPTAPTARYSGRVRLYVSEDYRRQHGEWHKPLLDLVHDASAVTGAAFGLQLQVVQVEEWTPSCDSEQLEACLDELQRLDPGDADAWVIGVLGALPRFTESFDELGMANVPGNHMVLRDVADLREREAIDRAFASFTSSRREEIYKRRRAHKRLAIYLHELGHTLGALHTQDSEGLLYPSYDDRMETFEPANQRLMAAGLEDRFQGSGGHDRLMAALEREQSAFRAADVEGLLASLRRPPHMDPAGAASMTEPAPPRHAFVVAGDENTLLAQLDPAERASYREAVRLTVANQSGAAWQSLSDLAARHPDCYAVQHLACGLLMQLGDMKAAQGTCPRAQSLATGR